MKQLAKPASSGTTLRATGLRKRFDGVEVLHGVDLELRPGEVHALVGENGAGKSTIINLLSGRLRPDEGLLELDGVPVELANPLAARRAGISVIAQELEVVPTLTIVENIFLGVEPTRFGLVRWRDARRQVVSVLRELGLDADPNRVVGTMGVADQQLVEIAKAIVGEFGVLVMDEPTSALNLEDTERLFKIVRRLKADGVAVLYVSHRLWEVFDLADRVTVVRDGSRIIVASRWALDRDGRGHQKRVLETNSDITQQKLNEKALRESEDRLRTLSDELEIQVRSRTQELEQLNAEILQQSQQLRGLSNRLLTTQDDERRRMARELHDSAGQLITLLGMNLAGIAQRVGQNPSLSETVEDTQNLLQQLSREIRTTSYLLHPPLLDENGLSQAIHWYMQGLKERTDLDIELSVPENFGRLPADLELTIFRIVQEGLTNIHRHSGSKTAAIHLSRSADSVLLKIEDHGKGISPEKLAALRAQRTGVGITGMRERVRHLKGVMDIQSSGTGATISVTFPVPMSPTSIPTSGSESILQSSKAAG